MRELSMRQLPSTGRAQSIRRRFSPMRMVLLGAGIGLVVVFVARVGAAEVARQIVRAGPGALWLLVPYAVGTAVGAFPWGLLLPPEVRPNTLGIVLGRFAASSANSLLPFFGLAGEPSRLLWLAAKARARGFAAIVVDRLLYNSANGALLLAGAVVAWASLNLPPTLEVGAVAAGVLTLAVSAAGFWASSHLAVGVRLQSLIRRALKRRYMEVGFGAEVDGILANLIHESPRTLLLGAGLHLAGRTIIALEVYVGLWILGAQASLSVALVLAVVPIALSLVFSSVPSQVGVQEGAQTLIATELGLDPALVLALVLLQRFRQLVFAALLPFLLAAARPRSSE